MIKKIFVFIFILLFPIACYAQDIEITVVYNNVTYDKDLATAWGFSCLIEGLEKTILFDTGGSSSILLSNMRKLGKDPEDVGIVVLSHIHGDHIGGLWGFLKENSNVTVFIPQSFPGGFKNKAKNLCEKVILVDKAAKICKNAWTTGELGTWMKEQSLVIDTDKGLLVITGCAHPGIASIVKKARDMLKKEVYLVMGGFHLMAYSEGQVKEIIRQLKKLKVKKVGPSHCTGGRPIELFREAWGEDFYDLGCGARIKIE